jgi:hypothetical protein
MFYSSGLWCMCFPQDQNDTDLEYILGRWSTMKYIIQPSNQVVYAYPIHELSWWIYKEKNMFNTQWELILSLKEFSKVKKQKNWTIIAVYTKTSIAKARSTLTWVHHCDHCKRIQDVTDNRDVGDLLLDIFFSFCGSLELKRKNLYRTRQHSWILQISNADCCFKGSQVCRIKN